jgi:electron transport complex protein RnfA
MTYLFDILIIAMTAALINNFVLYYFMGICSFIGVSRNVEMAFGMGCAVTFVITIASLICWALTRLVLMAGAPVTVYIIDLFMSGANASSVDLTILCYIVYIFSIAAAVQFVEMYIKKFYPALYTAFGVYLPLITTNCAILFACIAIMNHIVGVENPAEIWDLGRSVTLAFFGGIGYTIAISIMAGIREELYLCNVPKPFQGPAISLITGGILALAFMGFTGVDSGMRKAFMPAPEVTMTTEAYLPKADINKKIAPTGLVQAKSITDRGMK